MFQDIRLLFKENSHPEIRKTYFLAPKWGVNLYTGLTYTRVNTVNPKIATSSPICSIWESPPQGMYLDHCQTIFIHSGFLFSLIITLSNIIYASWKFKDL